MSATIKLRPIITERDYNRALADVAALMDAEADTPDGAMLDALATLISAYEAKRWPIAAPDPIEAIRFRMEQQGLKPKDLEPLIGSRGRVSEVLNRRRSLTLPMIRQLERELGISAHVLIGETKRSRPKRAKRR